MSAPLRCHWYWSVAEPATVTLNTASWPVATTRFDGCAVITGATGWTVTLTLLLAVVPAALLTSTLKLAPFSATVSAGVA